MNRVTCPACLEDMPAHTLGVHDLLRHQEGAVRPAPKTLDELRALLATRPKKKRKGKR